MNFYTVQNDEQYSLDKICYRAFGEVTHLFKSAIFKANPHINPLELTTGTQLYIPSKATVILKKDFYLS